MAAVKTPRSVPSPYRLLMVSTMMAVIALLAYFVLPEHKVRIHPDQVTGYHLFFDGQHKGRTQAEWTDEKQFSFRCTASENPIEQPYCGLTINLGKALKDTQLTNYQNMEVKLIYHGNNERLRIRLHNFDPASSRNHYRETLRGLDVSFQAEETRHPLAIATTGWVLNSKDSSDAGAMDVSVDLVPPIAAGPHDLQLEYIEVYSELLPASSWYLGVALLWLLVNLLIISRHSVTQELRIRNDSRRLATLASYSGGLEEESQKFKTLSTIDPLTATLNRNGFADELNKITENGQLVADTAIIMVDIDHFKRINDKHGHDAGDHVLQAVAAALQNNIRSTDKLARWGGEEFLLLCVHTTTQQALLIAEKLRTSIESLNLHYRDNAIPVTVSLGLGIARDGETFDELFLRSDRALYQAKRLGRNCVVLDEERESQR